MPHRKNWPLSDNLNCTPFEGSIFARRKTAYGILKSVVNKNTEHGIDFYKMRERFINDGSKSGLGAIIDLVDGYLSTNLLTNLKTIKEQRDFIAHGKRFGNAPPLDFSLLQIARVLDQVLLEIKG